MKKFTKVCLIIAAVCMVIGIGITAATGAMGVRLRDLPVVTYRNGWGGGGRMAILGNLAGHWDDWANDWEDDWDDWATDWEDDWDDWENDFHDNMRDVKREADEIPKEVQAEVSDAMDDLHEEMSAFWNKSFDVIETTDFTGIRKLDVNAEVGGVQIIAVDADDQDGDLVESNDIRVKVGSADAEKSSYRVYVKDGGKLCVETRWKKHYQYNNSMKDGRRIQILVPRGYQFDDVDLEMNAGALEADEILARSLDAEMNAGSMLIKSGNVEELDSEVNAGELSYQGAVSRSLDGTCKAGSMELSLKGKQEDYNYEVSATAGGITIGDDSYTALKTREIRNTGASAKMELSCMAGSLAVTFTE